MHPETARSLISERFRGYEVTCIYPGRAWQHEFVSALKQTCERVFGYSLGAHLLLRASLDGTLVWDSLPPVTLLAPFYSLLAGEAPEGMVPRKELERLRQAFGRNSVGAVKAFYRFAGMKLPSPPEAWVVSHQTELAWGLDQLAAFPEHRSQAFPVFRKNDNLRWGAADPLVNALEAKQAFGTGEVVSEAGHDLGQLISNSPKTP
ncbi:MAG: hypothetical protein ACFB21_06535 [Opitutales bacterium]